MTSGRKWCVLRCQAYTNGVFWASCNGANHGWSSVVIDPTGNVIAEAALEQEVLITEPYMDSNGKYDFNRNLRTEIYTYIFPKTMIEYIVWAIKGLIASNGR